MMGCQWALKGEAFGAWDADRRLAEDAGRTLAVALIPGGSVWGARARD